MADKAFTKVVYIGVKELALDYIEIARALAGAAAEIKHEAVLDPSQDPNMVENPRITQLHPEQIAAALIHRMINEEETVFCFSTSTASTPLLLSLASQNGTFGLIEHSPTDGATIRAWLCSPLGFEEIWQPTRAEYETGADVECGKSTSTQFETAHEAHTAAAS